MNSHLAFSASSNLFAASAGAANVSCRTEGTISPISLIMTGKKPAGVLSTSKQRQIPAQPSLLPLNTSDEPLAAVGMCCSDSTDWYESILICQSPEVHTVLTSSTPLWPFPKKKMEPGFLLYVIQLHTIQCAYTPSLLVEESISPQLDNKTISLSPRGSTQSNSSSTKLHIPQSKKRKKKRVWHTKKDRLGERGKREKNSSQGRFKPTNTHRKALTHPGELSLHCVQHNLLDSHGSESNILLHRRRPPSPDAFREEHQSKLDFWMTAFISTFIPGSDWPALSLYPPAMWARPTALSRPLCSL